MIRKIISEEEREAKERRNKKIIVVVLGLIMLFSSLSYAFLSFEKSDSGTGALEKRTYNGIDFTQTASGTWKFAIQGYNFETRYLPDETSNISAILTKNIQSYSQKSLYFGINKIADSANYGETEIAQNLGSFILRYQNSCLTNNCTENYPVKNCSADNVIIFRQADKSKISEENSCIVIQYNPDEEIMAADTFIYKLLGLR